MKNRILRSALFGIFVFAMSLATGACAEQSVGSMVLKAGDVLEVRIPVVPLLSKQYTIEDNGKIYFPVLEDVNLGWFTVAGPNKQCTCTVAELQNLIRSKLDEFFQPELNDVEIDVVSLTERIDYSVYLYGQVTSPGTIKYTDGMRLVNVIVKAGVFSEAADVKNIRISRGGNNLAPVDISGLLDGSDFSSNIPVQVGDIIVVPSVNDNKINVIALGRVKNIGHYQMPRGSRVLDLYVETKGGDGRAGIGRAYIMRTEDNKARAIHVDMKALMNKMDLSQNRELQDGDVFFIPDSKGVDVMSMISNITVLNFFKNMVKVDF